MSEINLSIILILTVVGLLTGTFSGMLGIGGGIIIIPALVYLMGFTWHQAIGTSLAVMLPPIGLFAAYNFYKEGQINITYALIIAFAFMIGSYFSSKIAVHLNENILRKTFSILMIAVSVKMFFTK